MELALNLCWLVTAVAAFGLWLRRPRYHGREVRCTREWVAAALVLTCILFFVFPVISVSDDVRAARDFLEEPAADQTLAKNLEIQKRVPLGQLPTPVAALAHAQISPAVWQDLGIVFIADLLPHDFQPLLPRHGRSPPQV